MSNMSKNYASSTVKNEPKSATTFVPRTAIVVLLSFYIQHIKPYKANEC